MRDKSTKFMFFALGGGFVALLLFLGTFIISSRAKTPNPNARLSIPVPQIPKLPSPTPKVKIVIPEPSPESTTSASPNIEPIIEPSASLTPEL